MVHNFQTLSDVGSKNEYSVLEKTVVVKEFKNSSIFTTLRHPRKVFYVDGLSKFHVPKKENICWTKKFFVPKKLRLPLAPVPETSKFTCL